MRVEDWNPYEFDLMFEGVAVERLVEAAELVKGIAKFKCPAGTKNTPIYKTGRYAGQPWTAREAGLLRKSIRVVRKKTKSGKAFSKKNSVRIYAGHYLAWYAQIVEFYTPYMRPALTDALPQVKEIVGAK